MIEQKGVVIAKLDLQMNVVRQDTEAVFKDQESASRKSEIAERHARGKISGAAVHQGTRRPGNATRNTIESSSRTYAIGTKKAQG